MSAVSAYNAAGALGILANPKALGQFARGMFKSGSKRQAARRAQQVRLKGGWASLQGANQGRKYVQKNLAKKSAEGMGQTPTFLSYRRISKEGGARYKNSSRYTARQAMKGISKNSKGNTDQSHLQVRRDARDARRGQKLITGPTKYIQKKSSRHSLGNMRIKFIKRSSYKGKGRFVNY